MMWNNFIFCLVLFTNVVDIHTFGLAGNGFGTVGTAGAIGAGAPPLQPPPYIAMAPSVEMICSTQSRMLNPRDRNGRLSDLVGKEISLRAPYLAARPDLAGAGKWQCAANYYTNVVGYRPSDLGNLFGDLIDSTGCDGFTCNPITGIRKTPPMASFLNAMLVSQLMQQPNTAPSMPVQQPPANTAIQQPTSNTANQQPPSNTVGQQQPANPITNQPTSSPIPANQPTAVMSTPTANGGGNMMSNMFSNPQFLEQMKFLISSMMNQNGQANQGAGLMSPSQPLFF